MGQIIKDQKDQNRRISYEDISSNLENRPDLIYYLEYENVETTEIIEMYVDKLEDFIEKSDLNTNEIKLGYALVELLKNYERVFLGNDNNKFNKNVILLSIREMTNMSTKEVRSSIKKYRSLYYEFLNKLNSE